MPEIQDTTPPPLPNFTVPKKYAGETEEERKYRKEMEKKRQERLKRRQRASEKASQAAVHPAVQQLLPACLKMVACGGKTIFLARAVVSTALLKRYHRSRGARL